MPVVFWPSLGSGIVSLLANWALETSLIFLPLFATKLGASKLQIGIIGGAYGVAYFVSSLVFSRQSDIRGKLLFIRLGLGSGVLALAVQSLVGTPLTLMFARAMVGFCFGVSMAALTTYNFEVGGSIGIFASLGSLGWLLGDVVAVFIQNYHILFLLSATFCGLAFAISLSLKEQKNYYSFRPVTIQVARRNVWVYLPFFLRQLGANMVWVILPLFFISLGASKSGVAILSGINAGGQFIAMMFVERLRESRLFLLGFVLSAVVFLAYSQVSGYFQVIPVQVLLAAAWSCLYVGALSRLLKNNEEKATSAGILFSSISISGAAGPFLGGLVAQFWGYQMLMYLASGLCLVGLGMVAVKAR